MAAHGTSNRDTNLAHVEGWNVDRLHQARALVVGAGALGNEVIKNLGLLGIGQVTIVDFDKVEPHNLTRSILFRAEDTGLPKAEVAARALKELNPEIRVEAIVGDVMCDLGWGKLSEQDLIFGCVDNRLARLWINRMAFRVGKGWISGGILNHSGQVVLYHPGEACYECGLTKAGWEDIQARMGCADMAQRYFNAGIQPTTPLAASIIGGFMVQEGLKFYFGQHKHRLQGEMWSFEGLTHHAAVYELKPPGKDCDSHFEFPEVVEVAGLSSTSSLNEALDLLTKTFGEEVAIELDHAIALEIGTFISKEKYSVVIPVVHLSESIVAPYRKISGEGVGVLPGSLIVRLDRKFPFQQKNLKELGIPDSHIIKIAFSNRKAYVLLAC